MTAFHTADHPRGAAGRFAHKQRAESDVTLDSSSADVEPSGDMPTVAELDTLRQRAEVEVANTHARKALDAAIADGMAMSDDPRVAARLNDVESAVEHAFAATPSGRAYLEASAARAAALRPAEPAPVLPSRSDEVRALLAQAADRRRDQRRQSPEELAVSMSPAALRVALRGLRAERPNRPNAQRIAVIEAELHKHGESVAR